MSSSFNIEIERSCALYHHDIEQFIDSKYIWFTLINQLSLQQFVLKEDDDSNCITRTML